MCDFSLQAFASRPAQVNDKLTVHAFGHGTTGFRSSTDRIHPATAVCVLPGTEIAFDRPINQRRGFMDLINLAMGIVDNKSSVAIFRQIRKDNPHVHHDALELPGGEVVLLTTLEEGQTATVLQLPAAPKSEQEIKDQTRLEVVG